MPRNFTPKFAPFGFPIRTPYRSEDDYFAANPSVAGMASGEAVVLNPYSENGLDQQQSVIDNEAARLELDRLGMTPAFGLEQGFRDQFNGTPYEGNETALRHTLAARGFADDPSAHITPEQREFIKRYLHRAT